MSGHGAGRGTSGWAIRNFWRGRYLGRAGNMGQRIVTCTFTGFQRVTEGLGALNTCTFTGFQRVTEGLGATSLKVVSDHLNY